MPKSPNDRETILASFLRELKSQAEFFRWYVDEWGGIRAAHADAPVALCPLTALAFTETGTLYRYQQPHEAAAAIGVDDVALELVDAIDNRREESKLRANLLKAVRIRNET